LEGKKGTIHRQLLRKHKNPPPPPPHPERNSKEYLLTGLDTLRRAHTESLLSRRKKTVKGGNLPGYVQKGLTGKKKENKRSLFSPAERKSGCWTKNR